MAEVSAPGGDDNTESLTMRLWPALSFIGHQSAQLTHRAIVLDIERAERGLAIDGRRGDQRVDQSQVVREVEPGEIVERQFALDVVRPDDSERSDQLSGAVHLTTVACILHQFHDHQAGHLGQFGQSLEPINRRRMASLNVNQDIGVEQQHALVPMALLRGLAQRSRMARSIGDVGARPDDAMSRPMLNQAHAGGARRRPLPLGTRHGDGSGAMLAAGARCCRPGGGSERTSQVSR